MLAIDANTHETGLFDAVISDVDLFPLVQNGDIHRERLDVGDAALRDEDGETLWTFEIKRGCDWAASIVDRRLYEQRRRAVGNPELFGTFAYIFEGVPPANDKTAAHGRLAASDVYGSIVRTSLRDGIHVFYTRNNRETADFLVFALLQQRAGKLLTSPSAAPKAGDNGVGKHRKDWALDHPTEAALLSVPGVGDAAAATLARKYGSLRAILKADEEELGHVKVNKRRLGPALAKKIKRM